MRLSLISENMSNNAAEHERSKLYHEEQFKKHNALAKGSLEHRDAARAHLMARNFHDCAKFAFSQKVPMSSQQKDGWARMSYKVDNRAKRLADRASLLESASGGSTGAGAIATVNTTMNKKIPDGQFFGGDSNASIYGPIKQNREKRKKKVEEEKSISILGANKVKRNTKALGPTDKISPEGPILGKPAGKKNATLSKKFFGPQ